MELNLVPFMLAGKRFLNKRIYSPALAPPERMLQFTFNT